MSTVSAVIITLNEEENIRNCLETVKWCDEIVIVDSYSEDDTVKIAKEYVDEIIQAEQVKGFDELRKKGIEKASGDWILRIDADEMIPKSLAEKLEELKGSEYDVIKAPRKNYIFGDWMKNCGWWPDYQVVMFRAEALNITGRIHDWDSTKEDANVKRLKLRETNSVLHFARKDVSDFVDHMNRYTSIESKQNPETNLVNLFIAPIKEFFKRYIMFKGYRSGLRGLILSLIRANYVALTEIKKFEKRLESEKKFQKIYQNKAEEVIRDWN